MKNKKIITLDIETDPFDGRNIPQPFLACVYDGKTHTLFAEYKYMPKALQKDSKYQGILEYNQLIPYLKNQDAICYAHNGGKFDYIYFKPFIPQGTELLIIDGRLSCFKIGKCEFRDSYNLFAMRLGDWEKDKIDYSFFTREHRYKAENWSKIVDYQKSDCTYLLDMLGEFALRNTLGITLPSVCMKKLKRIMPGISGSTKKYYQDFKPYYYGGRVQCFKKGICNKKFKLVDINSAYPWAMMHNKHPIGLGHIKKKPRYIKENKSIGPNMYKIRAISGGIAPYRNPKTKELYFPSDDEIRDYTLTGWEVITGLETSTLKIIKVEKEIIFDDSRDFADYIQPLWEERLKAKLDNDIHLSNFVKLEMNSTYGKFAANPDKYKSYMVISNDEADAFIVMESFNVHRELGYILGGTFGPETQLISKKLEEDQQKYYNVATGASITGCVRGLLFRNLNSAIDLLYCDTDSIAAVEFPNLDIGKNLGQWEIEGEYDHYRIVDKKIYAFHVEHTPQKYTPECNNWKKASKGGDLTPEQIKNLCEGETITYHKNNPTYSIYKDPYHLDRDFKMSDKPIYKIEVKK